MSYTMVQPVSPPVSGAYYGEFVQLERPKKNGQFGANRTVVFGDAERGGGRDAV